MVIFGILTSFKFFLHNAHLKLWESTRNHAINHDNRTGKSMDTFSGSGSARTFGTPCTIQSWNQIPAGSIQVYEERFKNS